MRSRNPSTDRARKIKKLGDRGKKRHPSKWDMKIHEHTGLTYPELRYKAYVARKDGISTDECSRIFGVSKGFVSKWHNIGKLSHGLGKFVRNSFLSLPMGRQQRAVVRDKI
jgi:hypothetical protein